MSKSDSNKELVIKNKVIGKGRPLICVPVMNADKEGIVAEIKKLVELKADMIEWRVDFYEDVRSLNKVREVFEEIRGNLGDSILVFTFRSKEQGGNLSLPKDEIYDLHIAASESGVCDFVDVEFFESNDVKKEIHQIKKNGSHVISSHHDFDQTPEASVIRMIFDKMYEGGTDIVKLALMPNSKRDVMTLLNETLNFHEEYPKVPLITMSMGADGCISRAIGEFSGSCVTFGARVKASAPGQLQMDDLKDVLDILHKSIVADK